MRCPRQVLVPDWPRRAGGFFFAPACDSKNGGNWFCVTHQERFANQLQKDIHIDEGEHELAWMCNENGPEAL